MLGMGNQAARPSYTIRKPDTPAHKQERREQREGTAETEGEGSWYTWAAEKDAEKRGRVLAQVCPKKYLGIVFKLSPGAQSHLLLLLLLLFFLLPPSSPFSL